MSPETFGPIESLSRLNVFNQYVPHAGLAIGGATVLVSVWMAARTKDRAAIFAAAAVVLALPVAAGVVLALPHDVRFAVDFAAYGLFATWFVLMWLATTTRDPLDSPPV
jgi:hypothetical protein